MTNPDRLTIKQVENCKFSLLTEELTQRIIKQLEDTMRENERLREALRRMMGGSKYNEELSCWSHVMMPKDESLDFARATLNSNKESDNGN